MSAALCASDPQQGPATGSRGPRPRPVRSGAVAPRPGTAAEEPRARFRAASRGLERRPPGAPASAPSWQPSQQLCPYGCTAEAAARAARQAQAEDVENVNIEHVEKVLPQLVRNWSLNALQQGRDAD